MYQIMNRPRYLALLTQLVAEHGIRPSARMLGVNYQSVSNWVNMGTEPSLEGLEKIGRHFMVPVPALLLEDGDDAELNDRIIAGLSKLDATQKQMVIDLIRRLTAPGASRPD